MTPNPYAPPAQPIDVVPPNRAEIRISSVGGILGQAFSIYFENFATIAVITLAVFGPVELAKNFLVDPESASAALVMRLEWVVSAVFGSLVSAAVLHALKHRIEHGQALGIQHALRRGMNSWGAVFGARFRSGLKIALGLLLLIVPGLIWAVRYTLTDEVATFETRRDAGRVMRRSEELVSGQSWLVAFSSLLALLIGVVPVAIGSVLLSMATEHWMARALTDWMADVTMQFSAVTGLVMYLGLSRQQAAAVDEGQQTSTTPELSA